MFDLSESFFRGLSNKFPTVTHILHVASPPCQEFSQLNAARQGWNSERGLLASEIPAITARVRAAFPEAVVDHLTEHVASMTHDSRDAFTRLLGVKPAQIDPGSVGWAHRPRLFWASWPLDTLGGGPA